jgi:hypothetical protein
MTFPEIITELQKQGLKIDTFAFQEFENPVLNIGTITEVAQYGGEGQGDTWYSVKHLPDHDMYIRVDGYYSSQDGTEFYDGWNSCSEVKQKQKTITVYEKI